mmetsp:Transcript_6294/g.20224  ORF Transcript_6294/g.20224 Transcript_6294/m.20224 type:complete len:218 (-) Transcript_6294:3577-4230(-)
MRCPPSFEKASSTFLAASLKKTYEESPMPNTANFVSFMKSGGAVSRNVSISSQNFTADLGMSPWPAVETTASTFDSSARSLTAKSLRAKHFAFIPRRFISNWKFLATISALPVSVPYRMVTRSPTTCSPMLFLRYSSRSSSFIALRRRTSCRAPAPSTMALCRSLAYSGAERRREVKRFSCAKKSSITLSEMRLLSSSKPLESPLPTLSGLYRYIGQ